MSSIAMEKGVATQPFIRCIAAPLFLYRKFLKQSEIVYNELEIKNDMTKERMVDSP